jgi:heme/copper-type cytochrome/quinol oxidase subunit 1
MATPGLTRLRDFPLWLLGCGLTLALLELLHDLTMLVVVNTLGWGKYLVRFLSMLYYIPAGIACIAFFVFFFPYLERATRRRLLLKNAMWVVGMQLLVISLVQLGLIGYRYLPASGLNLLLVSGEALAAVTLLALARREKKPAPGTP